jgi:hypothetical protein
MLNKNALLQKVDTMPIEELHALMCSVLDESGIQYQIAPGGIHFKGLSKEEPVSLVELDAESFVDWRYVPVENETIDMTALQIRSPIVQNVWVPQKIDYAA